MVCFHCKKCYAEQSQGWPRRTGHGYVLPLRSIYSCNIQVTSDLHVGVFNNDHGIAIKPSHRCFARRQGTFRSLIQPERKTCPVDSICIKCVRICIEYPRLAIYASRLIRFETIEPPRPPSWLRLFYTGVRWCLWPIAQTTHLLTSCLDDDLMHILCNCNANVLRVIALQLNALFDKTRNCILYQQKEVLNDTQNLAVYLDHIKSAKLNDFLSTLLFTFTRVCLKEIPAIYKKELHCAQRLIEFLNGTYLFIV